MSEQESLGGNTGNLNAYEQFRLDQSQIAISKLHSIRDIHESE